MSLADEAWRNRAGANRVSDAEKFDQAITELAREITLTALESENQEYCEVIINLLRARRVLREKLGLG